MRMTWDRGTLLLSGPPDRLRGLPGVRWDPRVSAFRAPAWRHAGLLRALGDAPVTDETRPSLPAPPAGTPVDLRPYQEAACGAWHLAGRRGQVILPTGAGKTRVAVAAIQTSGLRALCLVPTRVLLHQWEGVLAAAGLGPVGRLGDGLLQERPVTVATYASAARQVETLGNRFDLLVVDEVHHFGQPAGDETLEMCTASARLGLTATPVDDPVRAARLEELVGPEVYRVGLDTLAGTFLAPLDLVTLTLDLTAAERSMWKAELQTYQPVFQAFFDQAPGAPWTDLVRSLGRSPNGREALAAWRRSRDVLRLTEAKRRTVTSLLAHHATARTLVFTPDQPSAVALARSLLVPFLTAEVGRAERRDLLDLFRRGEVRVLVSPRVLDEGMDVPSAEVAVLVGGRNGVRQYVQRVGRVLRPATGKRALVYELVTRGTFEVGRSAECRSALV